MRHNPLFMPLALVSAMAVVQTVHAESFQVSDIRVEGLVRLTPASVYNQIPVSSGDQVDEDAIANAVRALYQTDNFEDVQAFQDGRLLKFVVVERPLIAKVEIGRAHV